MRHPPAVAPARILELMDRWVRSGVITPDQAARMRSDLDIARSAEAQASVRQGSLAVEALGYLGSVLVVVASVLLASQYWDGLPTSAHLALVGAVAVIMALGGLAVPQRLGPPGVRLRAVLWLGATVATAGFLALLGDETFGWYGEDLALLIFAGSATCAALLWWRLRTVVQQAAAFVTLAGTAAVAAGRLDGVPDLLPGLAIWGLGALWFILAWGGVITPRWAALVLGAGGLMVGSGMTMSVDGGVVLGLLTVVALVALALLAKDLLVLGMGAWGALQILPVAVSRWFPSELAAAVVLLLAGMVLVLIAIWVARRRRDAGPSRGRAITGAARYIVLGPHRALVLSAVVAMAVTMVILVLGVA